jgi:hypothetical protein
MYREPESQSAEIFVQPANGMAFVGCFALFFGIPLVAGGIQAASQLGIVGVVGVVGAVVLLLLAIYAFFNEETVVTLDERGLRLETCRVFFGMKGARKTLWEIPGAKLRQVKVAKHHSPAKNGGWNTSIRMHFGSGQTIQDHELGGSNGDTAFNRLASSLESRLGPGFSREDDFGPMTEAMRKLAAEQGKPKG